MSSQPPVVDATAPSDRTRAGRQPAEQRTKRDDVRRAQIAVVAVVVLAAIALAFVALSRDARRLAASNNVPTNGVAAEIGPGDGLCRAEVPAPAGSAGVRAFVVPRTGTGTVSRL